MQKRAARAILLFSHKKCIRNAENEPFIPFAAQRRNIKLKKLIAAALAAIFVLSLTAFFAACGSNGGDGGDGGAGGNGGTTGTEYSIAVEQASGVQLSADKQKAKSGETVTVTATVTDAEKYLISVTANGEECEESGGKYTFTVKDKDVTVAAELGTYAEKLSDGILSWDTQVSQLIPTQLTSAKGLCLYFTVSGSPSSAYEGKVSSSNAAAVPADALTLSSLGESDIKQGNTFVRADASKLSAGISYITLTLKDTGSASEYTVVKRIEVTSAADYAYTPLRSTVQFDVSALKSGSGRFYAVGIYDEDSAYMLGFDFGRLYFGVEGVQGFDAESDADLERDNTMNSAIVHFDIAEVTGNTVSVTFDSIRGHRYTIVFLPYSGGTPDYLNPLSVPENTVTGGSYADTQLRNGTHARFLTFSASGVILPLAASLPQ